MRDNEDGNPTGWVVRDAAGMTALRSYSARDQGHISELSGPCEIQAFHSTTSEREKLIHWS